MESKRATNHTRDDTSYEDYRDDESYKDQKVENAVPIKRCRRAAAVNAMTKLKCDSEDEENNGNKKSGANKKIDSSDALESEESYNEVATVSIKKKHKSKPKRKHSGDDQCDEDYHDDESYKEQKVENPAYKKSGSIAAAVKGIKKLKCDSEDEENNGNKQSGANKKIESIDALESEESNNEVATVSTKTKQETAKSKLKKPCQRKDKGADDESEGNEMDSIEDDGDDLSDGEDENKPCDTPIDYKDLEWYHTKSRECQVCETKYATFNEASECITKTHGRLRCYVCFTFWGNTSTLYKHYSNVHHATSAKRNTIICNMCSKSVPFQEVSYHMVKYHIVGIGKPVLKNKIKIDGYVDDGQHEDSSTSPKEVASENKAPNESSCNSSKYKPRKIQDNEDFDEDVEDEEITEREDKVSDDGDDEGSDKEDEEESDYEDEEESDDEENGPGKEDADYGDTIWYYASSKECQKCGKKYDTCREASKCITQNHARIRCYICFRFWRNTYKLFQHYSEEHVVTKSKPNRITCPLCLESVSFEFISYHMIEFHIAPTEENRDDESQNSESDFYDEETNSDET